MDYFRLRPLLSSDKVSLNSAIAEFRKSEQEFEFAFKYNEQMPFEDYVEYVNGWAEGKNLPDKFVPNTFLIGIVDNKIVGRVSLRHRLTEYLFSFGGHVGYGVVQSERNRGYATMMLKGTLPIALTLGIEQVLVTCDEDNYASMRVIEKSGGQLENIIEEPGKNKRKRRYWIDCRSQRFG
jgi:predicted acetyltransferase